MTNDHIIQRLRVMLHSLELDQGDYDTITAAIRALGGTP